MPKILAYINDKNPVACPNVLRAVNRNTVMLQVIANHKINVPITANFLWSVLAQILEYRNDLNVSGLWRLIKRI